MTLNLLFVQVHSWKALLAFQFFRHNYMLLTCVIRMEHRLSSSKKKLLICTLFTYDLKISFYQPKINSFNLHNPFRECLGFFFFSILDTPNYPSPSKIRIKMYLQDFCLFVCLVVSPLPPQKIGRKSDEVYCVGRIVVL